MNTLIRKLSKYGQRKASQFYCIINPTKNLRTLFYHLGGFRITHFFFQKNITGLNIGSGPIRVKGFYNMDVACYIPTDIVAGVENLNFSDNSVTTIYNSHVFEHTERNKALDILKEWYRVLRAGGCLYIALPDLEKLFNVYLDNIKKYDNEDNRRVADKACRIIYGGQTDKYDYHFNGYSYTTLTYLLKKAGFKNIERFDAHKIGLIQGQTDASFSEISLNIVARK